MKYTPRRASKKAKKFREAVYDYFPVKPNHEEKMRANKILTFLTRPSKGVQLTEEEQEDLRAVRNNIESGAYNARIS